MKGRQRERLGDSEGTIKATCVSKRSGRWRMRDVLCCVLLTVFNALDTMENEKSLCTLYLILDTMENERSLYTLYYILDTMKNERSLYTLYLILDTMENERSLISRDLS